MKRQITITSTDLDDDMQVLELARISIARFEEQRSNHTNGWLTISYAIGSVKIRETRAGWAIQVWGKDAAH